MNQSNLNQNEPRPETQNVTPQTTNEIELPKFASEEKSIGTLKKDTQKSPVAMLILFGILIAVIYFIPIVTPYFSDILDKLGISNNSEIYDGIPDTDTTKDNTDTKDNTQKEPLEKKTYTLAATETATLDKIEYTAFQKEQAGAYYYINYTITNKSTSTYSFTTHKIFLEFYDSAKTYLGSALVNTPNLSVNNSVSIKSLVNQSIYTSATTFQIVEKQADEYPDANLINNTLTCTLNNRVLTYTFYNNKLTKIVDTDTYSDTSTNYTNTYIDSQTKVNTLNRVTGVNAIFVPETNKFTTNITIDYNIVNSNLTTNDTLYYVKDTSANTIKYELDALGYTCN
ncbi:MAG TPA: hypothetical protein DHU33_03830 [Firmicutes bacterium]|nr:hypothetical protein [Bacillota bacterium]